MPARAAQAAALLFDAAQATDEAAAIPPATWRILREAGLLLAPFPAASGGEDMLEPSARRDLVAVLRLIGWGDLSVGRLYEGHVNAVDLVCRYGTPAQVEQAGDAVGDGALMGVWAAEDATGLSAEHTPRGLHLTGHKIFASGAGILARPVVTARSAAGPIMVMPRLAPGERADLSGWTALGMRATATGTVDLSGLVLHDDEILGQPGDFMRQPHFSGGAWRFCAVHLGGAERLLDGLRAHLIERKRDTDPYQLQRVAQAAAAIGTAGFWIGEAAHRILDASDDPARIVAFTNLTRMVTERAALDVLEAVQRGVGLQAFMRPHPLERVARDLSTYLRQPVPDLAMADAGRAVLASPHASGDLWAPLP